MPIAAVLLALALVLSPAVATAAAGPAPTWQVLHDPEPLIRVPFPDRPAGGESASRKIVRMLVGVDGFVRGVRFGDDGAPADSVEIAVRARRWIFRPERADDGQFHEVWVAIPLPRTGRRWIEQPDSLLLARLRPAAGLTAYRLLPPTEAGRDSVRRTGRKPVLFARHWVLAAQPDSTGELAAAVRALLEDPAAFTGPDPVATHCFPEPSLGIDAPGIGPDGWSQVLVSFGCGFLQVTTPEAVLHVPFGRSGTALRAVAARLFPGDPAFAAAPAPRTAR